MPIIITIHHTSCSLHRPPDEPPAGRRCDEQPDRQGAVKGLLNYLSTEDDPPLRITVLNPDADLTPEGRQRSDGAVRRVRRLVSGYSPIASSTQWPPRPGLSRRSPRTRLPAPRALGTLV